MRRRAGSTIRRLMLAIVALAVVLGAWRVDPGVALVLLAYGLLFLLTLPLLLPSSPGR